MSMYLNGFFSDAVYDEPDHIPAVVISNSVSTRISGAGDDIEVTLDDEGEFLIRQDGDLLAMNRDEAEALFMVLGGLLSIDEQQQPLTKGKYLGETY